MLTFYKSGLLDGINGKERSAMTWVYNRYYADVVRIVDKLVGYSTDNEDLVGEVFLKVMDSKSPVKSLSKLRDFIYMTSRTTSLDYIRDKELKQSSDMSSFYQNLNDHEKELTDLHTTFDNLMNNAASILPGKYRRILIMFYHDALPVEYIAKDLELSEKTVANLKSEALKKLKLWNEKKAKDYIFQLFSFL